MIDTTFARTMARYNRWQNRSLMAAADKLTDEERWKDRGAFFGSIAETLNHILWDHRVWLARQVGDEEDICEISAQHPYKDTPRDWSKPTASGFAANGRFSSRNEGSAMAG